MVAFSNPITGGQGALVRPAIKSPNYITGVSGWTIKKDGSAEFNNLTIRGTFFGTQYIIDSNGMFFYNGAPANGNLITSITSAAGTDSFGNAYPKGLQVGSPTASRIFLNPTGPQVDTYDSGNDLNGRWNPTDGTFTTTFDGSLSPAFTQLYNLNFGGGFGQDAGVRFGVLSTYGSMPSAGDIANAGSVSSSISNLGVITRMASGSQGPSGSGIDDPVILSVGAGDTTSNYSGSVNVGTEGGRPLLGTVFGSWEFGDNTGANLSGWQTASMAANWAAGDTFNAVSGYEQLKFRIDAEDNVWILGNFGTTSAAAGTTAFTLPAGFRPMNRMQLPINRVNTGGTITSTWMRIDVNGTCIIGTTTTPITPANGDRYFVNGKFPRGNLA